MKKRSAAAREPTDLTNYDPKEGLKNIVLAEAAEKHFAVAKDTRKLDKAIRAKLTAQADFVLWWDTQADKYSGRHSNPNRSVRVRAGRDGIPGSMVISRWRRLADPKNFEEFYEQSLFRYRKWIEMETLAHVGQNTGEAEWYTPKEYIAAAVSVMGNIDLDPASTVEANRVVKAAKIFTKKDDGLTQTWRGNVWMNPPYSQPLITEFCAKLAESVKIGDVSQAVVLVNNATETNWFRTLVDVASTICFPSGRVRFLNSKKETAAPLQGQAVLYLGDTDRRINSFCKHFSAFGFLAVIRR